MSSLVDDMIIYVGNPKDSTNNLLQQYPKHEKHKRFSLIKYMWDLYAHIYEGLMREIEIDLINGEHIAYMDWKSQCYQDVIFPQIDL